MSQNFSVEQQGAYIFPAQSSSTFNAVDVPNGVVASGHGAVAGFTFDDIHTGDAVLVSKEMNR